MRLVHVLFASDPLGLSLADSIPDTTRMLLPVCHARHLSLLTSGTHNGRIGPSLILLFRASPVSSSAASAVLAQLEESMKRSTERILTTHAGRLPNPDSIAAIQQARTDGDQGTFDRLMQAGVADRVR